MKPNHFAACCIDKRAAVDVVNKTESDGDFDVLEIRTTESKRGRESRDSTVTTSIEGKLVQLKVDTGAQADLPPSSLFNILGTKQQPYTPQGASCVIMGGDEIPHCGKVRLAVQLDQRRVLLEFFIVKKQAIFGLEVSEKLGFVNRVNAVDDSNGYSTLKQTYARLFTRIARTQRE